MITASILAAIMGCILIIAGIIQVFWQVSESRPRARRARQGRDVFRPPQALHASVKGIRTQSAYPGITMIGIGALVLGVGLLYA